MSTRVALDDDADGGRVDARQIDGDLDRVVGLVDVDRRRAFAGERLAAERAAELEEDAADLVGELTDFRRERDGVDAGAHRRMIAQPDDADR